MLSRLSKFITATGAAAAITTGAMIPRPASADTTSTLLTAAAAIGAIVLYSNYEHKRAEANTIVGYTRNGGTVYGDGRIVMPNGQTFYPNSNGQYAINNYGYNNGYNPTAYGYAPYGYYNNGQYSNPPAYYNNLPRYNTPGYTDYAAQRRAQDERYAADRRAQEQQYAAQRNAQARYTEQRAAEQQRWQSQNNARWTNNAANTNTNANRGNYHRDTANHDDNRHH